MNVKQLIELLSTFPHGETIYTTDSNKDIIELRFEDVYYGPIIQEEASAGINTLVIATKK